MAVSDSYRRRVERVLGMTMEEARRQGISFAAARGHKPGEHRTRKRRAIERGNLTEEQRAYLKRQAIRSGNPEQWLVAELSFRQMSHTEREAFRHEQMRMAAGYRRKVGGLRRGVNAMRSGSQGFVSSDLDMGMEVDASFPLFPLLFYH